MDKFNEFKKALSDVFFDNELTDDQVAEEIYEQLSKNTQLTNQYEDLGFCYVVLKDLYETKDWFKTGEKLDEISDKLGFKMDADLSMCYEKIKLLFNNSWIIKMCDDLISPSPFIEKNKIRVLQSLQTAIFNSADMSIPVNKKYKEALDYVDSMLLYELNKMGDEGANYIEH